MSETPLNGIRILVAKPGLDGHDRGAKVVARALRDAGAEVIYTGLRQSPEMIVRTAAQEDVDAIGLSLLSGAHMTIFPRIADLLRAENMEDVMLFGGGIISDGDGVTLKEHHNVAGVFGPGTSLDTIIAFVRDEMARRGKLSA
jgi:methylmalonyl-CoA mutase C-terminal domain/subunit